MNLPLSEVTFLVLMGRVYLHETVEGLPADRCPDHSTPVQFLSFLEAVNSQEGNSTKQFQAEPNCGKRHGKQPLAVSPNPMEATEKNCYFAARNFWKTIWHLSGQYSAVVFDEAFPECLKTLDIVDLS